MKSEKKVKGFWKKFNQSKSRSLIKKYTYILVSRTSEEKKKIYMDLKKQEEIMRKKKEEEEKKKAGNSL